jgi:integrase
MVLVTQWLHARLCEPKEWRTMPKTSKVNFTIPRVNEFKCEPSKKQTFLWDISCPGLGLRATNGGSRSFIFQSKLNGQTVRVTIGDVSAWPLPKVREEGRRLQRLIDKNVDPRVERASRKAAEEREGMTGLEAWSAYIEAHETLWSPRHKRDQGYLVRPAEGKKREGILRTLLEKKLADIDQRAVLKWAESAKTDYAIRFAKAQSEAAKEDGKGTNMRGRNNALIRGRIALRSFWRWMCEHPDKFGDLTSPDVLFGNSDLKALIPKGGVRKDCLERGQLKDWFQAVRSQPNKVTSAYLQILLLLGCRRRELSKLKWGHVDFRWGVIWLHDKTEQEIGRKVPLTAFVKHLFGQLPQGKDDDYVFATDSKAGYIQEPTPAHRKACSFAGLPPISLHGLRRSFGQLSEWCELPLGVVAEIQGHRPSALIERHYRSRPLDLLKLWHQKFEDWILNEANIPFDAKAAETGLHIVNDGSS